MIYFPQITKHREKDVCLGKEAQNACYKTSEQEVDQYLYICHNSFISLVTDKPAAFQRTAEKIDDQTYSYAQERVTGSVELNNIRGW